MDIRRKLSVDDLQLCAFIGAKRGYRVNELLAVGTLKISEDYQC